MKLYLTKNTFIKRPLTCISKHIGAWLLIIAILCVAFWIRIQGVDTIPEGQFTGNDAYFYYRNAQMVSENGSLPKRDMDRWIPLGRDLEQTLPFYAHAVAYTHKIIAFCVPNISLYSVTLYMPVICFCIGLGALSLFFYRTFGILFSVVFGVLLATLPGTIERSAAGFSDRDSWCLMLGILAVVTYLMTWQNEKKRNRILWTLLSGIIVYLGAMSWEGFGVFLFAILFVEVWKFLTTTKEERLFEYLMWVLTFVPALYFTSAAYRRGEWFATHLASFVLIPPLVLLIIRTLRYILLTKTPFTEKMRSHARSIALGFTLISIALAIGYIFSQTSNFYLTTVSLGESKLMQKVGELMTPSYQYWVFRYGSVFALGCFGLIIAQYHLWGKTGFILFVPFFAFTVSTFFRIQLDTLLGKEYSNLLFFTSITTAIIGLILIGARRHKYVKNEHLYLVFTILLLFWVALARDALRYDFFIGIPLAFFTATFLHFVLDTFCKKFTEKKKIFQTYLKVAATITCLITIMYWTPAGSHATRSVYAARHLRVPLPGHTPIEKAYRWMKIYMPSNAIVAAHWAYGSQLNVLANVKTIIDQDHYIQHWIHLYEIYVYDGKSEQEALEFLKTHHATHIMLTQNEPLVTYLNTKGSEAFVPIYPIDNFMDAKVKIWEIHYPPDVKTNPKYLETKPSE